MYHSSKYFHYAYRKYNDYRNIKIKLGENISDNNIYNIDNIPCYIITNIPKPSDKFGNNAIFIVAKNITNNDEFTKIYYKNVIFELYYVTKLEKVMLITDEIYNNNNEIIDIIVDIKFTDENKEIINVKIINNIKIDLIKNIDNMFFKKFDVKILDFNNDIWLINYSQLTLF